MNERPVSVPAVEALTDHGPGSTGAGGGTRMVSLVDAAPAWEDLCDRVSAPPWLRPGWFERWWTAFGSGMPTVAILEDSGGLAAVAPFARRGSGLWSMTNYHTPSWGIVARDDGARVALAGALMRTGARRITLQFVPSSGPDAGVLRDAAAGARRRLAVRTLERCPVVDTRADWTAYEAGLRGHFRRELRRRLRGIGELGRPEFEIRTGPDDVDALLDEGFAVEAAAWKGARGTAIASRAATERFYRSVGHWAAAHGWLRLAFLRLDGRAIAFDFALEANGVHSLLKTGYDPALRRFAPGMLLRGHMLRRAFDVGLASYHFLGHDDPWKREWTEAAEEQLLVQAFSGSPAGLADWAAHRWGRPVAKRLLRR